MSEFTGEVHPAADLFPMLPDDELKSLAGDIAERGLLQSIVLDSEGRLLDGRNRLRACDISGTPPRFTTYEGDDPIGFVLSHNLHRRHLNAGQRAAVAVAVQPMYAEEAKRRMKAGVANPTQKSGQGSRGPTSAKQAGAQVGVSHWSVESFKRIERADPELAERVQAGEITINAALKAIKTGDAKPARQKLPTEERAEQIRELAESGHRAAQIAEKLGVSTMYVRKLANEYAITLPDAAMGKTRALDPHRIVSETVLSLEGSAMSLDLIDLDALEGVDPEVADQWATSLSQSLKSLNRLRNQLKEMARVTV